MEDKGATMTDTLKDPICGMGVTPQTAAGSFEYQGNTYYFCSLGCMQTFQSQPEKYVERAEPARPHGCC
jgi:Cu+-exporting ATPase